MPTSVAIHHFSVTLRTRLRIRNYLWRLDEFITTLSLDPVWVYLTFDWLSLRSSIPIEF